MIALDWPDVEVFTISSEYANLTDIKDPIVAVLTAFEAAESLMITVSASMGVVFDDRLLIATVPAVMVSESPDAFPMVCFH